jgi:cell division transport system permease protein
MSILYIVKESISGFNRAKFAAVSSIMTVMISLLFLGIFYVVADNTSRLVGRIREKVEMEAFLEEPASRARIDEIGRKLQALEGVARVEFVSKDEAAKIFRQEFGEDILSVLDANPLPPSFKISLTEEYRTPEMAERLHERIMEIEGVASDVFRRDMLEFIQKQSRTLYLAGLGLGIFIAISAIILVSNTIRLAIDAKGKAVQTMKLVGASRWFIRAPFILEGVIQGILGGALAALVLYYLLTFVTGLISGELAEFLHAEISFYGMIALAGTLLGLVGSLISVRRFISDAVAG